MVVGEQIALFVNDDARAQADARGARVLGRELALEPALDLKPSDRLLIENSQCYEQALIYSNILASMMDARVSIVSNNLNWLMKTLTIITIAIQLPTLVVSIFSMNVSFPG